MKKFIPFGILLIIIVLALIFPSVTLTTVKDSKIDTGDTAW
ncbi:MAG: amt, partial [Mucilaginibacter sp.]|nr:amt [Mucilaginibacter sp.]